MDENAVHNYITRSTVVSVAIKFLKAWVSIAVCESQQSYLYLESFTEIRSLNKFTLTVRKK